MRRLTILACIMMATLGAFSQQKNTLTQQEKKEGWELLFDGKSTHGWHLYNKGKIPSAWVVKRGELICDPKIFDAEREDLVTDKDFENYHLKFEWKISKEGNSGVFLNVIEREDIPKAWASGPEYQLLESSHHDFEASDKKHSGCLYGFYAQKNPGPDKPAGEWNQSEIIQKNGKVEFYLNGVLTATEDFNGENWKSLVDNSGFKTFPEFGIHTKGKISLQDWSKGISFRNIKIKEL
ncbi:3-keto-disaccharide hydrolase [Jiulongibacter sp. NS-SX5]|uniref:3-keto-disaccharide hydrolase n=1 Tax=Jiulongibacter sp. NS-SX5 TaxID=3463854 RepID=UPI004059D8D3